MTGADQGTLYDALGVLPSSDDVVIRAAHRALVKKYHPDTYSGDKAEALRTTQAINAAFDVLGDQHKRRAYDRTLGTISQASQTAQETYRPAPRPQPSPSQPAPTQKAQRPKQPWYDRRTASDPLGYDVEYYAEYWRSSNSLRAHLRIAAAVTVLFLLFLALCYIASLFRRHA